MVETKTAFPNSFTAGDTLRITFSDTDHPSSDWSCKVLFQTATDSTPFSAEEGDDDAFDLVIPASKTAKLKAGFYSLAFVFTDDVDEERQTGDNKLSISILGDPEQGPIKSLARQTLENMETALLELSKDPTLTSNFNGQTFTNKNLEEFQNAIKQQRAIVNSEDSGRVGTARPARIVHPI